MNKTLLFAALWAATLPAHAVDGDILITQAKALAGNVTPGDAPGFPVTISQPGKYKLAGNLTVPEGAHGIQITSDYVTLDLNGFTLQGPVTCTGLASDLQCAVSNFSAIHTHTYPIGMHIRNGTIRGFGYGLYTVGRSGLAEDLLITEISHMALYADFGSIIRNNRLLKVNAGISSSGLLINNSIVGVKDTGIYSSYGGLYIGNQVSNTGSTGIVGQQGSGYDAALVHNVVTNSGGPGNGIWAGQSLGGGTDNYCEGNLC